MTCISITVRSTVEDNRTHDWEVPVRDPLPLLAIFTLIHRLCRCWS